MARSNARASPGRTDLQDPACRCPEPRMSQPAERRRAMHEAHLDRRRRPIDPLGAREGAGARGARACAASPTRATCSPRSRTTTPQVLVSDIRMPGGSGLDAAQQGQGASIRELPVIIMTAYSDLDSAVARVPGRRVRVPAQAVRRRQAVDADPPRASRRACARAADERRPRRRPRSSARRRRCRTCSAPSAGCRRATSRC